MKDFDANEKTLKACFCTQHYLQILIAVHVCFYVENDRIIVMLALFGDQWRTKMENGSGYTVAAAKLVHLLWRLVCQKHCVPANQVIHLIINIIKNILNSYAVSSVFRCAFCQVYPHFCCQNYAP